MEKKKVLCVRFNSSFQIIHDDEDDDDDRDDDSDFGESENSDTADNKGVDFFSHFYNWFECILLQ